MSGSLPILAWYLETKANYWNRTNFKKITFNKESTSVGFRY